MPRRARISVAGIPWHIIQRGNNRSDCFYAEEDRRRYLDTLRELAVHYGCTVHAYVLMTNHVHLLLTPEGKESPALLMKHLGQRYVQYINRVYRRTGTLWEGRFRSCLTQTEAYVLACYRYIKLNPVRANMVGHPADYPWSSYRANGEGHIDSLLTPHAEYPRLGRDAQERGNAYRQLFKTSLDQAELPRYAAPRTAIMRMAASASRRRLGGRLGGAPGGKSGLLRFCECESWWPVQRRDVLNAGIGKSKRDREH